MATRAATYVYLPALFIHHDLGRADSVWATRRRYQPQVPPLAAGPGQFNDWGLLAFPATGRVSAGIIHWDGTTRKAYFANFWRRR